MFDDGNLSVGKIDYQKLANILATGVNLVDANFRDELEKVRQSGGNVSPAQLIKMQMVLQRWQLVNEFSSAIVKSFGDTLKGILQRF